MALSDFAARNFSRKKTFGIYVSAKDTTKRVQLVEYDAKQGLTGKATERQKTTN